MSASDEIPHGFKLLHTLQMHEKKITRIAWSPDGQTLASASNANVIQLWDTKAEKSLHTFEGNFNYSIAWSPDGKTLAAGSISHLMLWDTETRKLRCKLSTEARLNKSVAWSPDGRILASGADDGSISLWDVESEQLLGTLIGHSRNINSVAWSPDGLMLASGSDDQTVQLWEAKTGKLIWIFRGHFGAVNSVAWLPSGEMLASASSDKTIRLWDPKTKSKLDNIPDTYISKIGDSTSDEYPEIKQSVGQIGVLKGHMGPVISISFSSDGRLLASRSLDGTIWIWRSDTGERVTFLNEPSLATGWYAGLAFHPNNSVLATLGKEDTVIRIWELDLASIFDDAPIVYSVSYRNAKVVLVGDTGVGKTGLSLVLTNQFFDLSESSRGHHVRPFPSEKVEFGSRSWELREILLWDLASQPNYRLIHQLHLSEATMALVVFDTRSETDPFAGVHYWSQALQQAQRVRSNSAPPLKKFLVAARMDGGRRSVSRKNIDSLVKKLGFHGYFETSAKEGTNIEELADAIRGAMAMDWDVLPKVDSTDLFERIKDFILLKKDQGMQLSTADSLYRMFVQSESTLAANEEYHVQFEKCIEGLESQDVIREFSPGDLVLLQPELLDAYASALINMVRDEPDGLGTIAEERVLEGKFSIPEDERLKDRKQENLLLRAIVEDLKRYEIALFEQANDQKYLVFPSLFTVENPDLPEPEGKTVSFDFVGPVQNVYTTLVVRLAISGEFKEKERWKNAAIFTSTNSKGEPGTYGIFLRTNEEEHGELTLFFDKDASGNMRFLFEVYVDKHLRKWASNRRPIIVCSGCGFVVPDQLIRLQLARDTIEFSCPVIDCNKRISLAESQERSTDAQQDHEIAQNILQGKIPRRIEMTGSTGDQWRPATAFLSYKREDAEEVKYLQQQLKVRGVRAWRDVTNLSLGGSTKEEITRAIEQESDAFVIYITPQCLTSDFIWNDEVPVALKRHEHDPAFRIVPIFRGVAPFEVQQFCAGQSLRSLSDFNGVSLPDSSAIGTKLFNNALAGVAERTLRATFDLRLPRVGVDRNYEPRVCFKTFLYEPSTSSLDLDLDWIGLFKSKDEVPTDEEWEEILFPALQDVKNVLSEKTPSRRLHMFVHAILPAAFALGYALPESAYFTLLLEGRHGTWSTEGTASDPLPLRLLTYPDKGDSHVALVEIAISRATAQGVVQSLLSLPLSFKHHIRFEPLDGPDHLSAVRDASHALAMAHQIGRKLRDLCDSRGVSHIHLFAALPDDLAVMVGHQLNALCPITLYHYVQSDKRYIRVCTLGK